MQPTRNGAFRLFNAFGVTVYLHWSWFLLAWWSYQQRIGAYSTWVWPLAEYLALFGLVLLHEFGHSLSCRQVGGRADQIVLWPLGGVAYVSPPQRPGAQLWSIAAGPLVNVAILLLLTAAGSSRHTPGFGVERASNLGGFLTTVFWINLQLLKFNLLPIYPLDGGQILRSLLWYPLGRGRSLLAAAGLGFLGVLALALYAWSEGSLWLGLVCFYIFTNCLNGWRFARGMMAVAAAPRHDGAECPHCRQPPPVGPFWPCVRCRTPFDPLAGEARCPQCQAPYAEIWCLDCAAWSPVAAWTEVRAPTQPPILPSGRAAERD